MSDSIRVLILIPREHSLFLQKVLGQWLRETAGTDVELFLGCVGLQPFSKKFDSSDDTPVRDFGYAYGGAYVRLAHFIREKRIAVLHTMGESLLYWMYPLQKMFLDVRRIHSSISLDQATHHSDFRRRLKFVWQNLDIASFPHPNVRDSAIRDLKLRREATVVAPFGLPATEGQANLPDIPNLREHPSLLVHPLHPSMRRMPSALRLALHDIQRERPDCAVGFRTYHANPKFRDAQDRMHIHLLLADNVSDEVIWQTILQLVSENRPFLFIGGAYILPHYLPSADLLRLPLNHPRLLRGELLRLLRKPEEFFDRNFRIQKALHETLRPSSTSARWRFHYKNLFEATAPAEIDKPAKDPFPDADFDRVFFCPECRSALAKKVSVSVDERAEKGMYVCDKGHEFLLDRGIPRFHEDRRYPQTDSLKDAHPRQYLATFMKRPSSEASIHFMQRPLLRYLKEGDTLLLFDMMNVMFLKSLAQRQVRVVVACSHDALREVQDELMHENNVRFVRVRRSHLPFRPETFDGVYLPEGNFDAVLASPFIREVRSLIKPEGRLHVQTHDLPFFWRTTPDGEFRVRAIAKKLPFGVSKYASRSIALVQEGKFLFRKQDRLSLSELERQWFRLLSYPDFSPVSPQALRTFSEDLKLSDVKLDAMDPIGFHLSGTV